MLFLVTRTSDYWSKEKPYKNCFPIKYHNYINSQIEDCWGIEINTLEELMEFQKDVGSDLILITYAHSEIPEIEIYDDYRE